MAWLLGLVALASASVTTHQGRLVGSDGTPINGTVELSIRLYDAQTDADELWVDTWTVDVRDGYYSVIIDERLPARANWLEVAVDGAAMLPRQPLGSPGSGGPVLGEAPAGLDFGRRVDVPIDTAITSNAIDLSELDGDVSAVLTGGDGLAHAVLLRNGEEVGTAAVFSPTDQLEIEMMSPPTYLTDRVVLAFVGGVTSDFSVATRADVDPDSFGFDPVIGAALSSAVTSDVVTLTGFTGQLDLSVTGGATWILNDSDTGLNTVTVQDGDAVALTFNTPATWETEVVHTVELSSFSTTWSVTNRSECEPGEQTWTSPGTHSLEITPMLMSCNFTLEAIGAGGGGGGSGSGFQAGGGAGGGGYAAASLQVDALSTWTVVVGSGGNPGGSARSGFPGGESYVAPDPSGSVRWVRATGGTGGGGGDSNFSTFGGGSGGQGSVAGDAVEIASHPGGNGGRSQSQPHYSGGGGGAAGPNGPGGSGGTQSAGSGGGTPAGNGGRGSERGSEPGNTYGGEGSGQHMTNNTGRGANGWVRISWE